MKIKSLSLLSIIFVLTSCLAIEDTSAIESESNDFVEKITDAVVVEKENKIDNFSLKATFSPEFGWGYQILNNDELYINQPHIPSVQGNKGFSDKSKAIKTAEYIIYKLKNNIFPPTVTPTELDSLNVL